MLIILKALKKSKILKPFTRFLLPWANYVLVRLIKIEQQQFKNGPITIAGILKGTVGLSIAARHTINALKDMGFKLTSFDISSILSARQVEISLPEQIKSGEGGVIIIQNNPIHIPLILFLIGKERLKHKKIIMYAVWELDTIPDSWIAPCKLVHEIWVPSQFVLEAYKKSIKHIPVTLVPHFVTQDFSFKTQVSNVVKVFCDCNINSGFYRKNVLDVITVFNVAASDYNATLLLKISGMEGNEKYMNLIKRAINNNPKIDIIHESLSVNQMQQLMSSTDILFSLHRSEGFGLVLAEGMWMSKAIIATGWSGNTTFLPADCAMYVKYNLVDVDDPQGIYSGDKWAQPDLVDAANKLRLLLESKKLRGELGRKARKHAVQFFSDENFKSWVKESLELGATLASSQSV